MASQYQISDWYGDRHTCHTPSGATGSDCLKLAKQKYDTAFELNDAISELFHFLR